jgi:phenylpropionate dioxygenase-like ring-hydroxylating dioxygenase large terminal subunit
MLSAQDNDLICRVGPGTPMGAMLRRYWMPALLSRELKADGDPLRLLLLGERLVAFRDSSGQVGIIDHECPHRCASLFYGRNEEGGLRCLYHGWKFAADGRCLDMANVPPQLDFKDKIRATAYPVKERGGVIWTYMGGLDPGTGEPPPLPDILANLVPESDVDFTLFQRECNWLQALEGDYDTSHVGFLHGGKRTLADHRADDPQRFGTINRAPTYEVVEQEWGVSYAAIRPADDGRDYWRIGQFLFPFWSITPSSPITERVGMRAWVPMDDTHTLAFQIRRKTPGANGVDGMPNPRHDYLPDTSDWYGRWRLTVNPRNDHGLDRARQRDENYSGIVGITQQDQAITESMGPIVNRAKEHLAPSDRMIMVARRRLLEAVLKLRDEQAPPPGALRPELYALVAGGYFLTAAGKHLAEVYAEQLAAFRDAQRDLLVAVA